MTLAKTEDKSLSIVRSANQPNYDAREVIDTIKQTVAKGASDAQLSMFLQVCKSTGLNPFLKEIWFVAEKGIIMAGRDGYLRVANEHPMFDGMETLVERDAKNLPIKATCKVWRKDRSHPITCEAYYSEYAKSSPVWQQYKSAMIGKVAEVLALKRSFSINGVVSEEEIGNDGAGSQEAANAVAQRKIAEHGEPITPSDVDPPASERDDLLDEIKTLLGTICPEGGAALKPLLHECFGSESWKGISQKMGVDLLRQGRDKMRGIAETKRTWQPKSDAGLDLWNDKFEMLKAFQEQKARLVREFGDTDAGEEAYYDCLKQFGVEKSNEIKNLTEGMKCFTAMVSIHPAV